MTSLSLSLVSLLASVSHSRQLASTACHCHTCDINVTSLSQLRVSRLSLSLVCHVFSVTRVSLSLSSHTYFVTMMSLSLPCDDFSVTRVSLSLVCHGFFVTRLSLSHFFKLRDVTVTCHTCDTTVTSLSRLACHCPCKDGLRLESLE